MKTPDFSPVKPLNDSYLYLAPESSGVYLIYNHAGPIYCGRSKRNIYARLLAHSHCRGNKTVAIEVQARRSLWFSYLCLDEVEQREAEATLIAQLGLTKFANMRHEGLYEEDVNPD